MKSKIEIAYTLTNTMTVGQLKELLDEHNDDTPVVFSVTYGDYHHTLQALEFNNHEVVSESRIQPTAYSQSGMCVVRENGDEHLHYCEECDMETHHDHCLKCGGPVVDEEGETVDPNTTDDSTEVLVLS